MPFQAVWSGSTLFAILSGLIRFCTVCHSQQSDQSLHYFPFSVVWSGSTLFEILSKQHYQGLQCLPLWAVWSGSTLVEFSAVWSGSTLFAILSSLIKVYTVWHSQLSDQGLHYLSFSAVWSRSTLFAILSSLIRVYTMYHSQWSDQGLLVFAILSSLIKVYTNCHSQKSDQGLIRVWSGSTLFTILKVYNVILRKSDQGLHYLPFFLSSIIKVYTVRHSQQADQGPHNLPLSAVS